MATLRLGVTDRGAKPQSLAKYFGPFHESGGMQSNFREEANGRWRAFAEIDGHEVVDLQTRLRNFGFMPHGDINGIFDYRTQSAARLYQEYVRSVEKDTSLGVPDAAIGPKTRQHLQRWSRDGITTNWKDVSPDNPTDAYKNWLRLLQNLKDHYSRSPSKVMQKVQAFSGSSDTRSVAEWDFSREHIHLIGIRRGAGKKWKVRINNDVFVLLVNGLTFMFFGSTDPTPQGTRRQRPPFLVPGQHLYRFGWHKRSEPIKVYRAFRPAHSGVLIIRDVPGSVKDALDETDLVQGTIERNTTINIHWSGKHTGSWSAGCQVISGGGYINHQDELVDCWTFASPNYAGLAAMTRAAYNVLLDLITVFSRDTRVNGGERLHYTLIDEKDLALEPSIGALAAENVLRRGLDILKRHDQAKYNTYKNLLGRA